MPQPTIERLIRDLDSDDTPTRVAARDALQQRGAAAVAPLLAALARPASDRACAMYAVTLERLGRAAFPAVVEALATEAQTEPARLLARVLHGLGPDCLAEYADALDHPSPAVRAAAAGGLGRCGSAALPHAAHLLPLLADTNRQVRDSARLWLVQLGPDVAPLLHQVRRDGPGARRRAALTVLADLVDPRELDPADQAAIRRLIRIKRRHDTPQPLTGCFLSWIAVRTGDQAGLLDLLGLSDPEPVTFALGADAADTDGHDFEDGPPCPQYARVFITPELEGWTLVLGRWCSPIDEERSDEVARLCEDLSARYGAAQAYFYGAQNDGSAWLVAEHGPVVRRAASDDEGAAAAPNWEIGEPLPFEQQAHARLLAEGGDIDFEWEFALLDMAPSLAATLSINPLAVGPTTPARGHGLLALTPYGREHGIPPGALSF